MGELADDLGPGEDAADGSAFAGVVGGEDGGVEFDRLGALGEAPPGRPQMLFCAPGPALVWAPGSSGMPLTSPTCTRSC